MQAIAKICRLLSGLWLALPAVPQARADPEMLLAVQRLDQRVEEIGYRLASNGGPLCASVPLPGFRVHDLSQYYGSMQADAKKVFGFEGGEPRILALASGSAAAAAGLRVGDALVAIEGKPLPGSGKRTKDSHERVAALMAQIERASADGTLDLTLRRDAAPRNLRITLAKGCATRFQMKPSGTIQSLADGIYVEINSGLIDFAGEDDQLAAVVAHELAHNILRHKERLNAVGIKRGLLGLVGRNARLTRYTEEEADRLSVYLLDRAGYPPDAAIAFWERYDKSHGFDFLRPATHMGEKARVAVFHEEIARLGAMKAAGQVPRPAFMEGPELPRLE